MWTCCVQRRACRIHPGTRRERHGAEACDTVLEGASSNSQQPPPAVLAERDAASNNCSSASRIERARACPPPLSPERLELPSFPFWASSPLHHLHRPSHAQCRALDSGARDRPPARRFRALTRSSPAQWWAHAARWLMESSYRRRSTPSAVRRRANAGSAHTPRRQSPVVAGSERPPLVIVARYEDCAITPVIPAASTALLLRSPCCGLRPPRCFDRPTASIARRLRPPSCFDHPAASTCPASTALRLRSPAASIAVRL